MAVTKTVKMNGHAVKRRKLSHSSGDEALLQPSGLDGHSDLGASSDTSDDFESQSETLEKTSKASKANRSNQRPAVSSSFVTSSTSLMLQAQSLIQNVKPDHASILRRLKPVTDRLIGVIKAIPLQHSMSLVEAESFARKKLHVNIPWVQKPTPDIKYSFSYTPPSRFILDGNLSNHLSVRGTKRIIIVTEMPDTVFQDKDYLNYRALHKRSFYLACITSAIQKEIKDEFATQFHLSDDNELVPVLKLWQAESTERADFEIEICPSFPASLGPIDKTIPTQNCIRKGGLKKDQESEHLDASPSYNSTVRWLASINQIRGVVQTVAHKADHFREACHLAAVWLQQRGFSSAQTNGGFGLDEWAILSALLLESGGHQDRPLFSPRYSAIQLFKAMLQVLSGRDMYDPFIVRGSIGVTPCDMPVFFDAATGVNFLYKMSRWSYALLKHHATVSLTAVNSKKVNGFESTFITKVSDSTLLFDESYEFDLKISPESLESLQARLYEALQKGLSDRATLIYLRFTPPANWKISSPATRRATQKVFIGLLTNSETATRLVDHGPPIEEKQAAKDFRSFWGEKAELRKFKDGRINESLVWSAEVPVTRQIVHFLLLKHFQISSNSVEASSSLQQTKLISGVPADEAFASVTTKFQHLSSTLHHLDGLPLPVRSVLAASELIRSTSLILPLEPGVVQPIDVFIQFDSSGRWPDDLCAIQYTKIAFLTKIGDLLSQNDRTLECRVGLENTDSSTLGVHNTSYLDVIQPSQTPQLPPLVFRLRIYHDRELQLIQQSLSSKTSNLTPALRQVYQSALLTHKQSSARKAHTTTLQTLITSFLPLSTTIRLFKRFLSAHHLTRHIPPEIAEIIACQVFLAPAPYSSPGTATTAFARCLSFVAKWDWSTEPLIADLSLGQDMTVEQRREHETRFAAWRKMDPNMNSVCWFVGTNIDATGVAWTQRIAHEDPQPPRVVAGRLRALATAATHLMKDREIMNDADWTAMFTGELGDFDFVIHLRKDVVAGSKAKANQGKFKNLQIASSLAVDTTGINYVSSYLDDLERCFDGVAVFFYGGQHSGSDVIGGLWRPHIRGGNARPWKIRLGASTIPVDSGVQSENDEAMCVINTEGTLAEMGMIGQDIVERISTNN